MTAIESTGQHLTIIERRAAALHKVADTLHACGELLDTLGYQLSGAQARQLSKRVADAKKLEERRG